ncbi:DMT family transporter [Pigmentiphaga kullae]|uniref:Drug/metabolite transporter (DMT)-like permease n=1 Tax=Pigmentiphaga kullae TaxID=151784 RepID=A0A4Q7N8W6_9BURK|nr:DMT family transporter [Pigmentiphaga kullae]RZS78546.1 drug/metabolite transporter (DMT)-like permease [Pigmentiphaga kullae]
MSKRSLDVAAIAMLVLLCASWGGQQVAVKIALPDFPPFLQMGIRSAGAGLLVLCYCLATGRGKLFVRDGSLWPGLFSGLLFSSEFVLLYLGLQWTDASRTSLFLYTAPFFVALGATWLLPSERLRWPQWVGLGLSFCGTAIVMGVPRGATSPQAWLGDLMIIGAAVFWAATTLGIKATRLATAPPEKVLLYQLAMSAVIGLGAGMATGESVRGWNLAPVLALTYQTVWIAATTFLLWLRLLTLYPASTLQAGTSMSPLFGVAAAALILHEPVGPMFLLAVALVVSGLVLVNRRR